MRVILQSIEAQPKGKEEVIRTLNYSLGVLRQNYRNIMHCYSVWNRLKEAPDE